MGKEVALNWQNRSSGITEQRIYRSVDGGQEVLVTAVDAAVKSFTDPVVGTPSTLTYKVGSVYVKEGTEYSEYSDPITLTISEEIPSDEIHFTTVAGSVDYLGTQGDQILLSDGNIIDITITEDTVTFNAPAGRHIVKLLESVDRYNYVSVGGEALVELHNFPTLSTVTQFNFTTYKHNPLPNLTKVPDFFPSNLTSLRDMFYAAENFNQDISGWDTSNVTNMNGVFRWATMFNQDISNWDVTSVTDMSNMFIEARSFNQSLNGWDVTSVTDMRRMFGYAAAFNQPLNNWNTSNVTNMSSMFEAAVTFNQDISMWDVSNVTNMNAVFKWATMFNQDISNWCVTNITSLPTAFATDSALAAGNFPVWGTCPRGENIEL